MRLFVHSLKKGQKVSAKRVSGGEEILGEVKEVFKEENKVVLVTPGGKEKTIDIVQFIVTILPLIDVLLLWISDKVRRIEERRKRRKAEKGNL